MARSEGPRAAPSVPRDFWKVRGSSKQVSGPGILWLTCNSNSASHTGVSFRGVNTPIDPKKLQHFVLWWFYVRLGLVDDILKVGQNWSMGRCPISKMIFCRFTSHFLTFYPGFQLQYFTWKCYQWCWIIPYTISRATCTPSPPSVALIKTCEAGLVLSVTRILRAALFKFRVYVCVCVCVTTPSKPLNRFA